MYVSQQTLIMQFLLKWDYFKQVIPTQNHLKAMSPSSFHLLEYARGIKEHTEDKLLGEIVFT